EGLRDALFLHSKGITNAVCIFGTKYVSMDNVSEHLMPFLLTGVSKVFLLLDGDIAGRSAAAHIELCISRKTDIEVEIVDLPDGVDPSTMDETLINMLTNKINYNTM